MPKSKTRQRRKLRRGSLAQLVEQRPEEPRVPSSSLGGATKEKVQPEKVGLFLWPPSPELDSRIAAQFGVAKALAEACFEKA